MIIDYIINFMFGFFPLKLNRESYCMNQDLKNYTIQ